MIKVIKPGLHTTVQDLGRYGFQQLGISPSGAMDDYAHRLVNILVGNRENAATLEMTLTGAKLLFKTDSLIAIGGAQTQVFINDRKVSMWRPIYIKAGSVLSIGIAEFGCRMYLAVSGGIAVTSILKSSSTYLRGNLGGYKGRALQSDDEILIGEKSLIGARYCKRENATLQMDWCVSESMLLHYKKPFIQLIEGKEFYLMSKDSKRKLFKDEFRISPNSDRMGYRLNGNKLSLHSKKELLSEGVSLGTIQLPSDGNPIVLMADRQTTGGYAKIAYIASVDLSIMAQKKPGDSIQFKKIALEEAQKEWIERELYLRILTKGVLQKLMEEKE
ncbi:MAG TPA: biotin-dependent carboxyltransferase family protein [Niallia sp.]|nr:biotin-dependent carboxyltransferase family protein [Niallia sp.]